MNKPQPRSTHNITGFTIAELLIVIVVIAILAAISIVAYTNIQQRARDTQRVQDIQTIAKALEMYYTIHGEYPNGACGSSCPSPKKINPSWATTSDGSWSVLEAALVPRYISALPQDPLASTATQPAISRGYNYDYVTTGSFCGSSHGQLYLIAYQLESGERKQDFIGGCDTSIPPYPASFHVVAKR